jgi:hypothetical protein
MSSSRDSGGHLPAVGRWRRLAFLTAGFVVAGAFYLLLIDITDSPELYAGAGAALLAALAFEAAREQGFAEVAVSPRWLAAAWRVLARVPADIWHVSLTAIAQLLRPRRRRGVLRAIPFKHGRVGQPRDAGRRALAQALGSLAPNTIVIGIDPERNLILAHQLRRSGGADNIDPLGLR